MKERVSTMIDVIVVSTPLPHTGGGYRALLSIKGYKNYGINPFLILPWGFQPNISDISFLIKEGINIYGNAILTKIFYLNFPMKRSFIRLLVSKDLSLIRIIINRNKPLTCKPYCVISMHETLDSITTSLRVSDFLSIKK